MSFNINPRPMHPLLKIFIDLLLLKLPAHESAEGEENQPTVLWHVYDQLTDCPGVQLEMRTHQAVWLVKFKVTTARGVGYGMSGTVDESVMLQLERSPAIPVFTREFGERSNTYRRKLRNGSGGLDLDMDAFLHQVTQSVSFFLTNRYPGPMPEFSSWLHTGVFSLPQDREDRWLGRAVFLQTMSAAPLKTAAADRDAAQEFSQGGSGLTGAGYSARMGLPPEENTESTTNKKP